MREGTNSTGGEARPCDLELNWPKGGEVWAAYRRAEGRLLDPVPAVFLLCPAEGSALPGCCRNDALLRVIDGGVDLSRCAGAAIPSPLTKPRGEPPDISWLAASLPAWPAPLAEKP